jgi:hypothetical protein
VSHVFKQLSPAQPSFLFIGPSKAGSSWFFEILREHPKVYVPLNKATFFFTECHERGFSWYEKFFAKAEPDSAIGEVCHDYLASPEALRRIQRYKPEMRLICCLRNPFARALSSWHFFGRNGMDQPTLAAQAKINPSVFDEGNYATQLAFARTLFPSNQLLIFFFEELAENPGSVARRLYEFIGVNAEFEPPSLYRRINASAKPRSRELARIVQLIHEQSWKRSRRLSNLIGQIKRIRPLRRLVRKALYREPQNSTDWRSQLYQFPSSVVSRYETEIRSLELMLGKELRDWHPFPTDTAKSANLHGYLDTEVLAKQSKDSQVGSSI